MNAFTKFVAMPMRGHGNVTGADVIMRWPTGYPFGIKFNRGYPRYNPGEFSTVDVLVRGDCDAAFIIGADPGATMPQPAIEHLKRIPTIVLDPHITHTSRLARVHITTAVTGHHRAGHGLSHGRDPDAAEAGAQVAVSDRRRSRPPDQRGDREEAVLAARGSSPDADRVRLAIVNLNRIPPTIPPNSIHAVPCCESPAEKSTTRPTASTATSRTSASTTAGSFADVGRRRPDDRCDGDDRLSRRRRCAHARRRRRDQLRPRA